jgi:hypothetical protein
MIENMATNIVPNSDSNVFLKLGHKIAAKDSEHKSELNPPENITPSIGTTINAILILLPLSLFLIGFYTGAIDL